MKILTLIILLLILTTSVFILRAIRNEIAILIEVRNGIEPNNDAINNQSGNMSLLIKSLDKLNTTLIKINEPAR